MEIWTEELERDGIKISKRTREWILDRWGRGWIGRPCCDCAVLYYQFEMVWLTLAFRYGSQKQLERILFYVCLHNIHSCYRTLPSFQSRAQDFSSPSVFPFLISFFTSPRSHASSLTHTLTLLRILSLIRSNHWSHVTQSHLHSYRTGTCCVKTARYLLFLDTASLKHSGKQTKTFL